MCLDTVERTKDIPDGYGYKVFYREAGEPELRSEYRSNGTNLPRNKWLKEYDFRPDLYKKRRARLLVSRFPRIKYKPGWHIFTTKEGVYAWMDSHFRLAIHQVQYRKAHTVGTQRGNATIVAKEIKILEEVKC